MCFCRQQHSKGGILATRRTVKLSSGQCPEILQVRFSGQRHQWETTHLKHTFRHTEKVLFQVQMSLSTALTSKQQQSCGDIHRTKDAPLDPHPSCSPRCYTLPRALCVYQDVTTGDAGPGARWLRLQSVILEALSKYYRKKTDLKKLMKLLTINVIWDHQQAKCKAGYFQKLKEI